MATGFGVNSFVGFGVESTFGTSVASSKFLEVMKASPNFEGGMISKPGLRMATQNHRVPAKRKATPNIEFQFPVNGAELLLKHALGSNTTTGESSPYTHTMIGAANLPVGLSVHINPDAGNVGTGSAIVLKGCHISTLTLTQAVEDLLMCAVQFEGRDAALENIETPTFPSFVGFHWEHFSLTVGATALKPESYEISINNTLATDRYHLGSLLKRGHGRTGPRVVSGGFTMEFEDKTEYNSFILANASTDIVAKWEISSAQKLTLTLPTCYLKGNPDVADAGPIKMQINFEAFGNTEGGELTAELINSVATIA